MMKKASAPVPVRHIMWLGWKLNVLLSLALCFFALLRLHFSPDISSSPSSFSRSFPRTRISAHNFHGPPRIAFLFLACLNLPFDFLRGSLLKVVWGESSIIQAEKLLIATAIEDPANQRFVLLSDRLWISLIRSHAKVIVDDEVVLPVFKKFCKRHPPLDTSKGQLNDKLQKQRNCIPDEHYVPTLFASAAKMDNRAWHPVTFNYADASPKRIKEIKDINHVYYDDELRTSWCRTNSTSVPCILFARKFSRGAAMRLLSEGVFGPFDISSLLGDPS